MVMGGVSSCSRRGGAWLPLALPAPHFSQEKGTALHRWVGWQRHSGVNDAERGVAGHKPGAAIAVGTLCFQMWYRSAAEVQHVALTLQILLGLLLTWVYKQLLPSLFHSVPMA